MAMSSKYGFHYVKNLSPNVEDPIRIEMVLANSAGPITIGDAVKLTTGFVVGCGTDAAMLGICVGFVDDKGLNIFERGATATGTKSGDDTYTATSSNQTVEKVRAVVNVDTNALFFAYADNTLTTAMVGLYFDGEVLDGTYVDGVDYTNGMGAYSAGTQQFQLMELVTVLSDGSASTKTGLFRIARSQIVVDPTA